MAWLIVLPVLLAACTGEDRAPPPCPAAVRVPDAQQLVRFQGPGRDLTDVLFEAQIQDFALICDYDDGVIVAEMRVRILAVHGPADRERKANFSYFVAITTRQQQIVAREEFALEIDFPGNRTRVVAEEDLAPRIPLKPGQSGADYLVYIGLALSPEELRYNRANR